MPVVAGCQGDDSTSTKREIVSLTLDSNFITPFEQDVISHNVDSVRTIVIWFDRKRRKKKEIVTVKMSDTTVYHGLRRRYTENGELWATDKFVDGL